MLILGILDFYRLAKLDIQRLMISDQHNKENVNALGKATKLSIIVCCLKVALQAFLFCLLIGWVASAVCVCNGVCSLKAIYWSIMLISRVRIHDTFFYITYEWVE